MFFIHVYKEEFFADKKKSGNIVGCHIKHLRM